jgi:hypothetical protein
MPTLKDDEDAAAAPSPRPSRDKRRASHADNDADDLPPTSATAAAAPNESFIVKRYRTEWDIAILIPRVPAAYVAQCNKAARRINGIIADIAHDKTVSAGIQLVTSVTREINSMFDQHTISRALTTPLESTFTLTIPDASKMDCSDAVKIIAIQCLSELSTQITNYHVVSSSILHFVENMLDAYQELHLQQHDASCDEK